MVTQKFICVLKSLFLFFMFALARKSEVKTIPKGPIFPEGELITYVQTIEAFPHDSLLRFFYLKFNSSNYPSICVNYEKCMHHEHLFDVPLLKENGKKTVNIELADLADQYFNINIERRDAAHIISLKINLTCKSARALHTILITNSTLQEKIELNHQEFITMKIRQFEINKKNVSFMVGDTILGTCEVEQCFSHTLGGEQMRSGKFFIVEEGDQAADQIRSVSDVVESSYAAVSRGLFQETTHFVAHCSKMVLSCRGSMDKNSVAPSQEVTVENVDNQFCRSNDTEFFLKRPNGSRTNSFTDMKEHERWQVVCKTLVNHFLDQPRLTGPFDKNAKFDSMEIPLNNKYLVAASVDFELKDCSVYGDNVKCEPHEGKVYKIPIVPKVCSTQILSISAEIYNRKSSKRTIYSPHVELKDNEELIISCHILVPKMVGLRRINITNAKSQSLQVQTSTKEDSLKRYSLVLEAFIPRSMLEQNEVHKYTCSVDHAWAESEISRQTLPIFFFKKTTAWNKAGLIVICAFLVVMLTSCLLDYFVTRIIYKLRKWYHRTVYNHYDISQQAALTKIDDEEETVFERASVHTHLLKTY